VFIGALGQGVGAVVGGQVEKGQVGHLKQKIGRLPTDWRV